MIQTTGSPPGRPGPQGGGVAPHGSWAIHQALGVGGNGAFYPQATEEGRICSSRVCCAARTPHEGLGHPIVGAGIPLRGRARWWRQLCCRPPPTLSQAWGHAGSVPSSVLVTSVPGVAGDGLGGAPWSFRYEAGGFTRMLGVRGPCEQGGSNRAEAGEPPAGPPRAW